MSVLHIVKVTGKSKAELVKALYAAINELDGARTTPSNHTVEIESEDDDDDMEVVESPYSGKPSFDRSTVVDNEVDSEGIPWDSRIHTSKKTQNKDGTWKLVKGVDKNIIPHVKAELRARVGTQASPKVIAESNFIQPTEPTPVVTQPVMQTPAQPVVTMPSAAAPIPQLQSGHTLQSFQASFALILSNLVTQGKLTPEYLNTLKNHFGVAEIWQASPEQQSACFTEFVNCGLIQRVG